MQFSGGLTVTGGITVSTAGYTGTTSGLVFNLLTAPSSGTTWTDASGAGYNATLNGSTSYVSSTGGGIKLLNSTASGGTAYISVPYNFGSNTITVEVVASFNPSTTWGSIWANELYNSGYGYLAYMPLSTSIAYGKPSGTYSTSITASNSIRQWIFVISGSTGRLYLNGSQVSTGAITSQSAWASNNLYFGARHTNAGTGFTDTMNNSNSANQPVFYQMRVYNKALSADEVTTNYNAIKGTYGI